MSSPAVASEAPSLQLVTLPDLGALAEPVQRQLRAAFESLTAARDNASTPKTQLASRYGQLGHLLVAATFFDEAVLCYRHAEANEPAEMRWPYFRAHAHVKAGDRASAASAFERALSLAPDYVPALVWLADMYLDTGRAAEAQATFARALALQPDSAAAEFGVGRAALARGAHAEAVTHLERALAIDPQASAVRYPLAMAYRAAGDRARAETMLTSRGSRAPGLDDPVLAESEVTLDSTVSLEGQGIQALRNQDWKGAAELFRRGLALSPDDPSLRYWLGTALFVAGDVDSAEREFDAVVRTHPDFARAHFSLGVVYERRRRPADALRAFETAVRYAPNLPEAHLRVAETRRAMGRAADSVSEYEEAVRLDPGLADAWIGGAQALIGLGRTDQAREWIGRARRVHPNRSELATLEAQLP